ncbi:hypothetical protein [Microbacterium pumilum]|uniref:hypothetical protein n=1 Tax=Microbacterium pumilum TaxID=344165 RepID=UPI0031E429C3
MTIVLDTAPARAVGAPSLARRRDHASRRRWSALHQLVTSGLLASALLGGLMLGVHAPTTSPVRPPAIAENIDETPPIAASDARRPSILDTRP